MNWEKDFSNSSLLMGKELYEYNCVSGLKEPYEHECRATVTEDNHSYSVRALEVNGSYFFNCSCQYFRYKRTCKHTAALMYAWDAKNSTEKAPAENSASSLFDKSAFKNEYFNLPSLLSNMTVKEKDLREADLVAEDDNFRFKEVETGYKNNTPDRRQVILLYGEEKESTNPYRYYTPSIELAFSKDRVESMQCEICDRYYASSHDYYYRRHPDASFSLCPHMIAGVRKISDYIRKYHPGDETSYEAAYILNKFGSIRANTVLSENTDKKKIIHLIPRLVYEDGALELSFRMGINKPLVVKNLTDLIESIDENKSMKLGKNNEVHFAEETFLPGDKKYEDFIRKQVNDNKRMEEHYRNSYSYYPYHIGSSMMLEGSALDEFYELANGTMVEVSDRDSDGPRKTYNLTVGDGQMKIHLTMTKVMDRSDPTVFNGLRLSGEMPRLLHGASSSYYLSHDSLVKLNDEDVRKIEPFITAADHDHLDLTFGKNRISEFYYKVLPELQKHPFLEIDDHFEDAGLYLPPEAHFRFYLDVDDDFLLCRTAAVYDEQEFNLHPLSDADYPLASVRDAREENRILDEIKNLFPSYQGHDLYCQIKTPDTVYDMLDSGIKYLLGLGDVHVSDAFDRMKIRRTPAVRIGVSVANNLLDLDINSADISPDELMEILNSYRRKKKYHQLKNGEFIALNQEESLDTLTELMDSMGISLKEFTDGKLHLPLYRALYVNKMLEDHDNLVENRDRHFRSLIKNFNTISDSDYDIPKDMNDILRGYQKYGYKWMRTLSDYGFGGILADDMGLGKTIQTIAMLNGLRQEDKLDLPAIIICPTSVVYNWAEEFERFAPEIKTLVIAGTAAERKKKLSDYILYDVLITSYELLKRDIHLYENIHFSYEIIDEGQFIKNARTGAAKTVKILHSDHRFALTGTPIENRLSELWSIFDFLMPGFLYSYEYFKSEFETPIARNKDELITKQLRRMVSPFILRRLKEDVLKDLPEKLEEVRYAHFAETQQKLYTAQLAHMKQMVRSMDEEKGENKIKILAELTRLRQVCCDPALFMENYDGESAKREACLDLIENAITGEHKILVFSQFTTMLELLEEDLNKRKIRYYKITGETSKENRMKYVHQFNEDDTPVFLISLKAGGTGLNLTGADIVIHYDPWWNLAAQNQATDRAHRIGQTKKVTVFKLIAKDTVEEKIMELQNTKKDLADAILTGEATSITSLSKEELLELLS